ncbi:MAG: hypothetical protein ACD_60C00089G0005 [uncultured bacterium]|nr:MAG: hypothetical protein ACD_60C00089G0005 [uncultured bacterium]
MYDITIQRVTLSASLPSTSRLKRFATAVLKTKIKSAELNIRIVDKNEMTQLNSMYRQKHKPTNVLSFPFDMPKECESQMPLLGDIVICAEVIAEEALAQKKTLEAHWAHMIVHGTLHLLGYDHEKKKEADLMEAEEIKILHTLGFHDPYHIIEKGKK